jgi:hypothetical protein
MNYWGISTKVSVLLAALALLPAAGAQAEVFESGSLQLKLSQGLAKSLKRQDVRLVALRPAKGGKGSLTLPVSEAVIEGHFGGGYLALGGGFRLRAGKKSATVKRLLLHTADHYLTGFVNGTKVKLASLPPQRASVGFFDVEVGLDSLAMTPRAASILNRRLGLRKVFKAGRSLGAATADVRFSSYTIRGGQIDLAVDPSFRERLQSIEADVFEPSVSMPAQFGLIRSSLTGGFLSGEDAIAFHQQQEPFEALIGFITTGVDFDSGQVGGDANVNYPGASGGAHLPYSGPVATISLPGPFQFDLATGQTSATGIPLALSAQLAALMNEVFGAAKGKPDFFKAGEPYGTLGFVAQTR